MWSTEVAITQFHRDFLVVRAKDEATEGLQMAGHQVATGMRRRIHSRSGHALGMSA
jgi:hypothetical protein